MAPIAVAALGPYAAEVPARLRARARSCARPASWPGLSQGVAQPGSAPALGAGGRRFNSSRPDQPDQLPGPLEALLLPSLDHHSRPAPHPILTLISDPRTRAVAVLLCQREDPTEVAHRILGYPRRGPRSRRAHLAALELLDQVARAIAPHPLPLRHPLSHLIHRHIADTVTRWTLLLRVSTWHSIPEIAQVLRMHRVTVYRNVSKAITLCARSQAGRLRQHGNGASGAA